MRTRLRAARSALAAAAASVRLLGTASGTAVRMAWRASPALVLASMTLAVLSGATPGAAAWLTKTVLDRLAGHASWAQLTVPAVGLALAGLVAAVAPQLSGYAENELRRSVNLLMQAEMFAAINGFAGMRRFEDPRFHDRLRLAQQAGQSAPQKLVAAALIVAQSLVTLAGLLGALFVLSPLMAVVVLVSTLPAVLAQLALSRQRARFMWRSSPTARRQLFYAALQTDPVAAKEVRLFGLGDWLRGRMLTDLRTVNTGERALDRGVVRTQAALALLGALVAAGGLVYAIAAAARGSLTLGDVTVFVAAIAGAQSALSNLVSRIADSHQSATMFEHYLDVVRSPSDLPVPATPAALPALRRGIELRDVWFRYDESGPWVLRGVDLFLPYGQAAALVGLNGAGKSTLVKLVCRFYDPTRGSIRWDGVDIRDVPVAQLRDRIGAVFQDHMNYDLSAAENVGLGDLSVLDDRGRIRAAADAADIDETLAGLPRGYDTMLSRLFYAGEDDEDPEVGVSLSGGQWQRVALARALLRQGRDLLILDEPSSGLDAEAEHAIHERLRAHRAGRTSLLISHRLGAVRQADLIVVLAGGRIVERGDHATLLAAEGEYARLFALQAAGYQAENAGSAA
ncbi:multidrug ABC transporter permease [Actinocatenispora thailandica]|uniref:Multidrug ABC transporter permease n=1 Tax=Actinocatenispora thailandica TaxID=227318 RepID=A0A7R7HVV2_9ACTN|nr:ABC transporter ATP-binding protein [Actinocatenispora thailandica]BCJ33458.1 multidrug ABC transporter permease [Actinocatenispora thailandica]